MDELLKLGFLKNQLPFNFDNYEIYADNQKQVLETIKRELFTEKWFVFCGKTGTGKGHIATSIAKEFYNKNLNILYLTAKKIIDKIYAADFSEKLEKIELLETVDLLVIDEIGRHLNTKYFQDVFFDILNTRYGNFLKTIFITNLTMIEFNTFFDEAMNRRLKEIAIIFDFNWQPYYNYKTRKEFKK